MICPKMQTLVKPIKTWPPIGGGSAPPPSYERTAFVSSAGDNNTAVLNDDTLPYLTMDGAVPQLYGSYAGQTTTIRLLSDLAGGLANSAALNNLLTAGLTIQSHDATVRSINDNVSFGELPDALLTLSKVNLISLVKVGHASDAAESAGVITGDADTTITTLNVRAGSATAGGNGAAGSSGTGANGADGSSGDPPTDGAEGALFFASGSTGAVGSTKHAWNVSLAVAGLCSSILGEGGTGGNGGNGGNGGAAQGGNGGVGGDSTSATTQNGGNGGNGGAAVSNGGDGGNGGNGGNGSTVTNVGWTITASTLSEGVGGSGGVGGSAGSAGEGNGGAGGAGAAGGSSGDAGVSGTAEGNPGANGAIGSDGNSGSII